MAVALLAGGRSRRMGHDKALAAFAGTTLIEWSLERLAPAFPFVFVVAKDVARFRDLGVPVVADARAAESPTVGVYTAVAASPSSRTRVPELRHPVRDDGAARGAGAAPELL